MRLLRRRRSRFAATNAQIPVQSWAQLQPCRTWNLFLAGIFSGSRNKFLNSFFFYSLIPDLVARFGGYLRRSLTVLQWGHVSWVWQTCEFVWFSVWKSVTLREKKMFQVSFIAKIWKASIISQQEVRRRNCGDVDLGYLCVCLCMCARLWASQIIHTQLHWINFTDWKKNLGAIANVFVIFGKHCWCVWVEKELRAREEFIGAFVCACVWSWSWHSGPTALSGGFYVQWSYCGHSGFMLMSWVY